MWPLIARSYDRFLGRLLARFVKRPRDGMPSPTLVPAIPDDIPVVDPIVPKLTERDADGVWHFEVPSPVPSAWKASQMIRGRTFGPEESRKAVLVLHGACDSEYRYWQWMGDCFARQGYRVLIPAAPCHMDRTPKGYPSGAALFWSAPLLISGLTQWLTEIRGLIDWLRIQGVQEVGLVGYSLGSFTAGIASTLWPDLDFSVVIAPVGHHLLACRRSLILRGMWPWMLHIPPEEVALMNRWAPENRHPLIKNILFLITLLDDLQPTELQLRWWRAWGQPAFLEYDHSHMSALFSKKLYQDLEAFAAASADRK